MHDTLLTRDALHALYAGGVRAHDVVATCLDRIAALADPGIFLHQPARAELMAAADALPPFDPVRHPLWGMPFAVKDNIDVAGWPTTAACPAFAYRATATAPVVQLLLEAGALLLGKTNLDQFATGLVGVRTPHAVPRNAFDPARVPGGSSSGSAVAVAQHLVGFSLGTDTAGSGRIPAALNHLVGLKPSLGALSTRGVIPACRTLDCVSIFATTAADAEAVFRVAAVYDAREPYSRPVAQVDRPMARIGIPAARNLLFFGDAAAAAAWHGSVARLRGLGLDLVEVAIDPLLEAARLLYEGPWVAERRAAIADFMDAQPGALHPVTRAIVQGADAHSAVDAFRAFYKLAVHRRAANELFERIDVLAVPTAPIFPTLAELEADPIGPNSRLGTYTNFVNLLDLAAIAAPGPFRPDGLPAGATFIAPAGCDLALAGLAARFFPGLGGARLAPAPAVSQQRIEV